MILDDALMDYIAGLDEAEQASWLVLSTHPDFRSAWYVDSLDPSFLFDFEDLIGEYRVLFPADLGKFKQQANKLDYRLVWTEDPTDILASHEALSEPPPFAIKSSLPSTRNGFLPWQIEGFNKLILPDDRKGGLCLWDTGTGKTVFVAMGILWHVVEKAEVDLALVVVKSNNKRDMQKKLKSLAGIDSVVLDGSPIQRAQIYTEIDTNHQPVIAIANYEKFREDQEFFEAIFTGRRILIFWDEMPTKLRNRGTQLYKAVLNSLYQPERKAIYWRNKRPSWLRQYELTATPIERDPGDHFSCVRLIDPDALGNVTQFERAHVISRDPWSKKPKGWTSVEKIGHKLNFMTHRADKSSLEIAQYFPRLIEEPVYIDWDPKLHDIYRILSDNAILMFEEGEDISILSLISVLQMLCDAPSMINASALKREAFETLLLETGVDQVAFGSELAMRFVSQVGKLSDERHTKLKKLREDLLDRHPKSKVILFSTWADYIFPVFEKYLSDWEVSHVVYKGTDKQKQMAKDYWRSNDDCRVLVTSDSGSDSIDLPEASLVINYNLPWLYSRLLQRINRASRADSPHQTLWVRNYCMAHSVEERRQELIEERKGYHDQLVGLNTVPNRYSKEDLLWVLIGANR